MSIIALIFCFWSNNASAATISKPNNYLLTSGLLGWWTFDGADMARNVADRSGSGNAGYLTNFTSTSTSQTIGKLGQALKFPAPTGVSTSSITVKHSSSLSPTSAVSVSAWIKPNGIGTCGSCYLDIIKKGSWSIWIGFRQTGSVIFYLGGVNSWVTDDGSGNLFDGKWHHVVFNYDGSMQTFYIDGTKISETVASGSISTNSNDMTVGSQFSNLLDDVRLYDRALTASEITALYKAGGLKVTSAPTVGGSSSGGLNSGLVGHWTFDANEMIPNVRDRSGSGKHGNLIGQTSTTTTIGKLGQGIIFDGNDDYVDVGNNLSVGSALSVSMWVNIRKAGTNETLIDKNDEYAFYFLNNNLVWKVGTTSATNASVSFTNKFNQWHFVTGVWDGVSASLWLDGVLIGTDINYSSVPTANALFIGQNSPSHPAGNTIDGSLDDVRIYNRALSASEIAALYKLGGSKVALTPTLGGSSSGGLNSGLVGHWTFDGVDMRPNVRDRSGQGNHGNLVGQTATTAAIGKLGQALKFDGVNDYVNCGSNASVLPDTFSFSAWVKTNTAASTVLGLGDNASPHFVLRYSVNRPLLQLAPSNYRYWSATTPTNLVNNDWHHYVVVLPGNSAGDIDNAVLYVDGNVQNVEITVNSDAQASKSLCKLGGLHTVGTINPFNGVMDDARLYNRVLSASEVLQLYNLGR